MSHILVLYYSRYGATQKMAEHIARGIEKAGHYEARIRTVPEVSPKTEASQSDVTETGAQYVTKEDLTECAGLAVGSPTRFGNMAAPLKYFIDTTVDVWLSGGLIDKPAGFFTSTGSMHGGQETTLTSMMNPFIHQGCIVVGVPYSEPRLSSTTTGGTPYGPSHLAGAKSDYPISEDEKVICQIFGERIANIAKKLETH